MRDLALATEEISTLPWVLNAAGALVFGIAVYALASTSGKTSDKQTGGGMAGRIAVALGALHLTLVLEAASVAASSFLSAYFLGQILERFEGMAPQPIDHQALARGGIVLLGHFFSGVMLLVAARGLGKGEKDARTRSRVWSIVALIVVSLDMLLRGAISGVHGWTLVAPLLLAAWPLYLLTRARAAQPSA
jgi:hypothetical protein